MEDLLSAKYKASVILLSRAEVVYEEFEFILGTARLDITIPFKNAIDTIRESAEKLTKFNVSADPWEIAESLDIIDANFSKLAEIANNFDPSNVSTGASYTYIITTKSDIDSFLQYFRIFAADPTNESIYILLSKKISETSAEEAEARYMKFPHSSSLFARFLQDVLNTKPDDEKIPYLLALERAKDRALLKDIPEKKQDGKSRKKHTITWPLQRFGLVPAAQHLAVGDLARFYWNSATFGGARKSKVESEKSDSTQTGGINAFIALAKVKKVNVLVISAITMSPIEYNVSTLLQASPEITSTTGVSEAVLRKFNTVHKHIEYGSSGQAIAPKHLGFSVIEHKIAPISRRYVVVRTIDDHFWDCLRDSRALDNFVDSSLIKKILRGASPRIEAYNSIKSDKFVKFVMQTEDVGETIKKANKGVIQDLVNRITGRIIQYVDTALVPLPTDPRGLETAISDPKFVSIMTEEFLKSYSDCGIDSGHAADEFIGTFIADFETNIAIQFARNIKLNMIELGPSATVFRDFHGETLRTRLYNLFVDVIKRSVTNSIMTKENIYEKIFIKEHMLKTLAAQLSKAEQKQ